MIQPAVVHHTFVIERSCAAWADPEAKARWFNGPEEWGPDEHEIDFHVGGRERSSGGPPGEPAHVYDAIYMDIVPNGRIISAYEMRVGEVRISVSLATVEFSPDRTGTRLAYTEQGAYFDGAEGAAGREAGSLELLDALGTYLDSLPDTP